MDWEFGISRCKLLCIGWRNNLLYITGNTQYPVINNNENVIEKRIYIYIYIYIKDAVILLCSRI